MATTNVPAWRYQCPAPGPGTTRNKEGETSGDRNFDIISPRSLVTPGHLTENEIWAGTQKADGDRCKC